MLHNVCRIYRLNYFLVPIGMVLRDKYDIFSFLGAICILFALMFMAFWYTCSLEVQDREMPKIQLPERSKVPPKVRLYSWTFAVWFGPVRTRQA